MTNNITGIDIRKALIAAGLRPSNYDEQGIFEYINDPDNELEGIAPDGIVRLANAHFKVRDGGEK